MNPVYKSPRQRLFENLRQEDLVEESRKQQEKSAALSAAEADRFMKMASQSLTRRSF